MKRTLKILLFLLCSGLSYAQNRAEVFSVYFHADAFRELTLIPQIASVYHKKYQLSDTEENKVRNAAGEYLFVDATGVYLEKNKLLFITREQVREDSRYQVRDGYIFGVVENDSLPTALDGENYYFLIPSKTYLVQTGTGPAKIYKGLNEGEYLVASAEPNGHFSCIYLRFKAGKLDMMELPLETEGCSVKLVKDQQVIRGEFNTFILKPVLKEWQTLFGCFSVYDDYVIVS